MTLEIRGVYSDRIVISGDIDCEFGLYLEEGDNKAIAFSDGTLIRVEYDNGGEIRFTLLHSGTSKFIKEDVSIGSPDIATLSGEIHWVALADDFDTKT